jgi:hypothetical protein
MKLNIDCNGSVTQSLTAWHGEGVGEFFDSRRAGADLLLRRYDVVRLLHRED